VEKKLKNIWRGGITVSTTVSVIMASAVVMTILTILMCLWYLKRGYSYKHTIDELPDHLKIDEIPEHMKDYQKK